MTYYVAFTFLFKIEKHPFLTFFFFFVFLFSRSYIITLLSLNQTQMLYSSFQNDIKSKTYNLKKKSCIFYATSILCVTYLIQLITQIF